MVRLPVRKSIGLAAHKPIDITLLAMGHEHAACWEEGSVIYVVN